MSELLKYFLLICALFFLEINYLNAQNKNPGNYHIDSLKTLIKNDKDDSNKVNHLNSLCRKYFIVSSYDSAKSFHERALPLAQKINFYRGIEKAYYLAAEINSREMDFLSAIENYSNSIAAMKITKNKVGMASAYLQMGLLHRSLGDLATALKHFILSLKINDETGNKKEAAACYGHIGNIYLYQQNHNVALENFSKGLKIRLEINDKLGIGDSYNNIGLLYAEQKNYPKALEYYFKSADLLKETGDKANLATSLNNIGNIYSLQGNYNVALENLFQCLEIRKETKDKYQVAICYDNIGATYKDKADYKQALAYLKMGLDIFREIDNKEGEIDTYKELSETNSKMNNYEEAYKYQLLYSQVKDIVYNEESSKQIHEASAKYETEKKDKEIIKKNAEIIKQQAKEDKTATQRNAFIIGFVLLLIVAFLILRSYNLKQKSSKIIEQKNQELERLSIVASETDNVVIILSPDGTVEWANEGFTRLNGITIEELKRRKGPTIFEISNHPDIRKLVEKAISEKRAVVYESLNLNKEGKKIWESTTLNPIFDPQGKLKKLVIIDTDVTQRKEAEELIKEKNKDIMDSIRYAKRIQQSLLPTEKYIDRILKR